MSDKELNAECSLCWKCKFALCIQETEQERVYHAGMFPQQPPSGTNEFGMFDSMPFEESNEEPEEELLEHIIEHERVKAVCFYKPAGVENSPPILVANVKQCNAFEKK